ncbi:MAG: hypothetical protein GC168_15810 [Candidatus Hydrogenedens sp.]|nr:hypothetical protein [Candidatus Hydrogenedens sp.]
MGNAAYIGGATPASGAYAYLTHDHLGSVRGAWSGAKARLASYAYAPYGETAIESGLPMDLGFTGHQWDAHAQFYHAPYRAYSPGAARWISRLWVGFQTRLRF